MIVLDTLILVHLGCVFALSSAFSSPSSTASPASSKIRLILLSSRSILHRFPAAVAYPRTYPTFLRTTSALFAMENSNSLRSRYTTNSTAVPPVAPRDEQRFVYAGAYDPLSSEKEDDEEDKDKDDLVEDGEHPNHSMPSLRQAENDTNKLLDPPVAIPDPYGALRDDTRTDAFVLDHLRKENEYTDAITAHLAPLRESLYQEMLQAIQETDYSTPAMDGPFWYYTRTFEGKAYTVHCRAPATITSSSDITDKSNVLHAPTITWDGSPDTPILTQEQIYLDENVLAANKSYCSTGSVTTSPNHSLLAYTVDFTGNERFQLHVQDVDTGRILMADESLDCSGHVIWGRDEKTLVYLALDEVHRPYRVYRRRLLEPDTAESNSHYTYQDDLLFEEKDDLFATSISKTADKRYLLIHTSSTETSEIYYLDLTDPTSTLECVASRNKGVLYDVEHWEGYWLVTTNIGKTPNMRLMVSPVESECALKWKDVSWVDENGSITKLFDGGYSRALDGIDSFRHYAAAHGREGGIPRIWLLHIDQSNSVLEQHGFSVKSFQSLKFPESAYDVAFGENYEYNTSQVTISYDSLITPPSSLLVDMKDPNNRMVLKERNVRGYVKGDFGCERRTVLSRDGKTEIPISIVYRSDVMEKHISSGEPIPVHLYGYGSYGICMEADFRSTRLPLLNRGMVYVIAHVRGGGEMGRNWYEEPEGAKYLCKQNTFNDFIDVGHWLVHEKKMTTPSMLSCEGRSAGGLLIGASINQRPDLFGAAILGVPFLDVVCTMVDSSIPLTCGEWEEWGNPNTQKYFDYMMSYSPMNTVKPGAKYPSCLLTGGLHDPRVQFWEPAKFAQQLRYLQGPDSGPVCLKMEMSAGHFSASDRYKYLRELAFDYAFLLDQLALSDTSK